MSALDPRPHSYLVLGTGGHAKVIASIIEASGSYVEMINPDEAVSGAYSIDQKNVIIGVGDNYIREQIATSLPSGIFGRIVHPSAVIAADVKLGDGVVVMPGVVINSGATIGDHAIVNTNATIEHDCSIGNFTSIAPNAALGGGVRIGVSCAIGIGVSIVHQCYVGDHTIVGAGAVVTRTLPDHCVCYGVPARVIRPRQPSDKYLS